MDIRDWLGENNTIGLDIWTKKYQRNDETFEQWLDRVSGKNEEVKQLIKDKKFLFGGRILSNRGVNDSDEKTTLSNCYVISPPEDSIESIYETCSKLARTYSYGGGCGIDISKLSPSGAKVHNQAKNTSGAVSFMDTFSQVTEQIGQNGRRGALMISLDCNHPDLEKFITIKSDLNKVTSANISVRVSDEFMRAVEEDKDWELSFTRPETSETISKTIKAKEIYKLLCKNNWDYAEPGILFWDKIENYNLLNTNSNFKYAGTNPCAEEPLPAGGSCLLGSINLSAFVTEDQKVDYNALKEAVRVAITGLNEVLDEGQPKHPLKEQRDSVKNWRQCGLGIMGLADMLIKLGITYGSKESIELCNKVGDIMATSAIAASSELAGKYGSYPEFNAEEIIKSSFYKKHSNSKLSESIKMNGLRNSQLLTIAPCGSISTMLNISGGIEPIFANSYTRMTKSLYGKDVSYKVYTPIVKEYMDKYGFVSEDQLPGFFVTSADISIENRIAMQAVWQNHIDASISSTVNLPEETTIEDVEDLYMEAWKAGLKGITVFRSGCKRTAILTTTDNNPEEKEEDEGKVERGVIFDCSDNVVGRKKKLQTGCGSTHVLAYFDPDTGDMQEVYLNKGSTGGCANYMTGLSRMISLALRAGVDIYTIKDQLDSTGACPSYAVRSVTHHDTSRGSCCPMAIGNALVELYEEFNRTTDEDEDDNITETKIKPRSRIKSSEVCPECGEPIIHENGCISCPSCGYSKCG